MPPSLPATLVDDFTRADGNIDADTTSVGGYTWASPMHSGDSNRRIVSNACAANGSAAQFDNACINRDFSTDIRVSYRITAIGGSSGDSFNVLVRIPYTSFPATFGAISDYYRLDINQAGGNDVFQVYRVVDGAFTQLTPTWGSETIPGEWAVNDEVAFECYEAAGVTILKVYRKPAGGYFALAATYSDSIATRPLLGKKVAIEGDSNVGGDPSNWIIDDLGIDTLPLRNTFETDLADETGITVANSDDGKAGHPFTSVNLGSGTCVFDNGIVMNGARSAKFTQSGANANWLEYNNIGNVTELWLRFYMYRTGQPSGSDAHWIVRWGDVSDSRCGMSYFNNAGLLFVQDSASSTDQSNIALPLNQWLRYEYHVIFSATVGVIQCRIFRGNETAQICPQLNATGLNTRANCNVADFGQVTGFAAGGTFYMDDIEINPVALSSQEFVGPSVQPTLTALPRVGAGKVS